MGLKHQLQNTFDGLTMKFNGKKDDVIGHYSIVI